MQGADQPATPTVGGIFRCEVPVRWGDMDALSHVNNTLYFRYIEEARAQLYEQAGLILPGPRAPVLVHASCDFLKPLLYPATAVVSLIFTRLGRSSMDFDVLIECTEQPGVIYARGKNITVSTDAASGKSSPWTAGELAGFAVAFTA